MTPTVIVMLTITMDLKQVVVTLLVEEYLRMEVNTLMMMLMLVHLLIAQQYLMQVLVELIIG